MALELIQSTAVNVRIGPFLTSDGTPNAGLTITQASIWVCKNEAAFAVKSDSGACVAESLGSGWYGCPLDGTDTGNPGNMILWCEYSGVLPVWHNYVVVQAKQTAIYAQLIAQASSTALAAYDAPTSAEISAALTAIEARQVAQAASTALASYDGPTDAEMLAVVRAHSASLALTAYDPPTKAEVDTSVQTTVREHSASLALTAYDPSTDTETIALVRAHSASLALIAYDGPTKAEVDALAASTALAAYDPATPVWAALRPSHLISSSFGALLPSGIQANKALANIQFLMVDSTDHRTPKTGLTVTGYVSLDAAAFGATATSIAEVANGTYQYDAQAADMNGGTVTFRFTATGADDCFITFLTTKTVTG